MKLSELIASLPPPLAIPGARRSIREALVRSGTRLVVIDDDPTGTQTVHDTRVLLDWSAAALSQALARPDPLFFISTNSRSLPRADAEALAHEVGRNLRTAARQAGARVRIASRSDSTLRGHFPAEVDALAAELPAAVDGVILVPAFFDAGRYTINNVHWVELGGELVPAHLTEFARDPDFGFAHGDLREWVQEKTAGRINAGRVICVSIEDLRRGGPERVAALLSSARNGAAIVANAACDEDLEVLALAAQAAEENGRSFIYRTSASFVKVRAGVNDRPLLSRNEMQPGPGPGLIIAGSYVARTSAQIERLAASGRVLPIEISVQRLLDGRARPGEIRRVSRAASESLAGGVTVLVHTSRKRHDASDFLAAGRSVMAGLCEVVAGIEGKPGFLVAKGGITSIAVAKTALGCGEAMVLGQALKGVPVWRLGLGSKWSDIPYVVFPGNVGEPDSLLTVVETLMERG